MFHFVWNLQAYPFDFQLKKFFVWLDLLGYPIQWLEQISKMEYLEKVLFLAEKSKKILVLEKIGIIDGYQRPNEKELLRTMTVFQQIVSEIRGN